MDHRLRDIAAGEELTYDYNLYDGEPEDESRCLCGAKTCRGTLYSEEEIEKAGQAERKRIGRRSRSSLPGRLNS